MLNAKTTLRLTRGDVPQSFGLAAKVRESAAAEAKAEAEAEQKEKDAEDEPNNTNHDSPVKAKAKKTTNKKTNAGSKTDKAKKDQELETVTQRFSGLALTKQEVYQLMMEGTIDSELAGEGEGDVQASGGGGRCTIL